MKKSHLKTLTLSAAALASLGLVQQVQADELASSQPLTSPLAPVSDSQLSTAQTDLATAQSVADKARDQLQQAETKQASAEGAVTQAEASLAQAQADQAKLDQIPEAQKAVETAKANLSEAATVVSEANLTLADAKNQEVLTKEAKVSADQAVSSQEAEVAAAQALVNEVSAQVDGTAVAQAEANLTAKREAAAASSTALTQAEQALVQAQAADAALADKILAAKVQLTTATAGQKTATAALATASDEQSQAQDERDSAQSQLDAATQSSTSNSITLSSEYIAALKAYTNNPNDQAAIDTLKRVNQDLESRNVYISNAQDKAQVIDYKNLTAEEFKELNLFALELHNQIRRQAGTPALAITEGSLAFAQDVAKNYTRDQFGVGGHDNLAINDAAAENGLRRYDGSNIYEDMYATGWSDYPTMDDLKKLIYDSYVGFMLNGDEWLHANSIAGIRGVSDRVGISVSQPRTNGWTRVHVLSFNEQLSGYSPIENPALYNSSIVAQPLDANTVDALRALLAEKEAALSLANQKLASAEQALAAATVAVTQAETALATLQATPTQTAAATARLTQAQSAKTQADLEVTEAQTALQTAVANQTGASDRLAKAQAALTTEVAKLETLKAELTKAQDTLTKATENRQQAEQAVLSTSQALAAAETLLAERRAYLAQLETAPARLQAAQAALALTQGTYDLLKNRYDLQDRLVIRQEADGTLTAVSRQAPSQADLPAYDLTKLKTSPADGQSSSQAVPAGTASLSPSRIQTAYNRTVTQSVSQKVAASSKQGTYQASLPATGEETSHYGLAGLWLLTLTGAGLGWTWRRKV